MKDNNNKARCAAPGCTSDAVAKGLCRKHYQRSRRSDTGATRQPKTITEGERGVTLTFVATRLQDLLLRAHSQAKGVSIGVVVRDALNQYIMRELQLERSPEEILGADASPSTPRRRADTPVRAV